LKIAFYLSVPKQIFALIRFAKLDFCAKLCFADVSTVTSLTAGEAFFLSKHLTFISLTTEQHK
jgi:hypothetical protein